MEASRLVASTSSSLELASGSPDDLDGHKINQVGISILTPIFLLKRAALEASAAVANDDAGYQLARGTSGGIGHTGSNLASAESEAGTSTLNWLLAENFEWLGNLILVAALISLIVISIVGNCLVCVAIFTERKLRKLGNAFIVSLAIADLFVSCLVMTFALCNELMNYWIFGDWFCDIWISFDIMCCTASILNLCAISLDRFILIKDCLLYNQWMTRKVASFALILIWFISALVSFVPINLGWHKPHRFKQLAVEPLQASQSFNIEPEGQRAATLKHLNEPSERQRRNVNQAELEHDIDKQANKRLESVSALRVALATVPGAHTGSEAGPAQAKSRIHSEAASPLRLLRRETRFGDEPQRRENKLNYLGKASNRIDETQSPPSKNGQNSNANHHNSNHNNPTDFHQALDGKQERKASVRSGTPSSGFAVGGIPSRRQISGAHSSEREAATKEDDASSAESPQDTDLGSFSLLGSDLRDKVDRQADFALSTIESSNDNNNTGSGAGKPRRSFHLLPRRQNVAVRPGSRLAQSHLSRKLTLESRRSASSQAETQLPPSNLAESKVFGAANGFEQSRQTNQTKRAARFWSSDEAHKFHLEAQEQLQGRISLNEQAATRLTGQQLDKKPMRLRRATSRFFGGPHLSEVNPSLARLVAAPVVGSSAPPPPPLSTGDAASQPLPQCMLNLTPTYAVVSSTISFYIPCIIMIGLYTKLFACAQRHVKNIQSISKAPAPIKPNKTNIPSNSTATKLSNAIHASKLSSSNANSSPPNSTANSLNGDGHSNILNGSCKTNLASHHSLSSILNNSSHASCQTQLSNRAEPALDESNAVTSGQQDRNPISATHNLQDAAEIGNRSGSRVCSKSKLPANCNHESLIDSQSGRLFTQVQNHESNSLQEAGSTSPGGQLATIPNNSEAITQGVSNGVNHVVNSQVVARVRLTSRSQEQDYERLSSAKSQNPNEANRPPLETGNSDNRGCQWRESGIEDPAVDETRAFLEPNSLIEEPLRELPNLVLQPEVEEEEKEELLCKRPANVLLLGSGTLQGKEANDANCQTLATNTACNNNIQLACQERRPPSSHRAVHQIQFHPTSKVASGLESSKVPPSPSPVPLTQPTSHHGSGGGGGQLATHKAAVTLGIIMGTFLFCWVPFFCLNIIKAFCGDCIPSSVFRAFTWLGYANSALNPIIYGIHNSEFRSAFNRVFFKYLSFKSRNSGDAYLPKKCKQQERSRNRRRSNQASGSQSTDFQQT